MNLKLLFRKVFLVLILFSVISTSLNTPLFSQIVNIEGKRINTENTEWAGFLDVGFSLQKSEKKLFKLKGLGHVQYKTINDLFLLLTSFEFITVNNGDLENRSLVHFRYNRKLNSFIRWEAFVQQQFNRVKNIKNRFLLGTGPRFELTGSKKFNSALGLLYMYEIEKLTDSVITGKYHRISSYLSFSFSPSDKIKFVSTTYYQPNIKAFSDYRISSGNNMIIKLSSKLAFTLNADFDYDSFPAAGIDKISYSISNSLRITFQ